MRHLALCLLGIAGIASGHAAVVEPASMSWSVPTGTVVVGSSRTVTATASFNYSDDGFFNPPGYQAAIYRIMVQLLKPDGTVVQLHDWLPGAPVGSPTSASPSFTTDQVGQYYVRFDSMDTRPWYTFGGGYSGWVPSVNAINPNTPPSSSGIFSPTTLNFGQAATLTNTMTDAEGNITLHTLWWDQGSGKQWTNPVFAWNFPPNSTGFESFVGHYNQTTTSGLASHVITATFRPAFAGSFSFLFGGYDSDGAWTPWVSGVNVATITVNRATPVVNFAPRTFALGGITYAVQPSDLNAAFTNPHSGAVAAPTGPVTYSIVGPGTAVSAGTLLTAGNSYVIRATYSGDSNYNSSSGDAVWTIGKAAQSAVAVTSATSVLLGTAYTATASGGNGTGAIVWELRPGSTAAGAAIVAGSGVVSATSVGTVLFRAYRTGDGNYFDSAYTADFAVTVTPKPVTFSVSPTSFTYSGGSQGPAVSPSDGAASWSVTAGQQSAVNAGSYSLTATANGNYTGSSGAVAWSIAKATPSVSFTPTGPTVVVGGSLTFTAAGGQTGYAWGGTSGASGGGATKTVLFSSLGSYTVTVQDPGNANWNASGIFSTTVTVVPMPTSFTFAPTSFTYNGGSQGPTITPSPGGATYTTSGTTRAVNAGSYSVTATANGNYTGSSGAVGWSIGKAGQVGVVVTSPSSFAFQSAYTAAASGGNGSGAIIWALRPGSTAAGAAINSSTGVVSATSVGTVIFRAYRTGDGNYFDSAYTADFTVTVTPKPVTFSISPTSFTYSGGSQGPTVSPSDGAATWSVTAGQQSAVNAGSYSLTATANGNYSGSSGAVAWSIGKANQAALAPSASPSVVAYGNTSALAASGGSGTGLVSFSATAGGAVAGSTFTALAGTGSVTVTATKAADANFNAASGTATITLAARPVTIALSGSRAYDGTTGFSAPLAAVPSGLVSGDTLFGAAAAGAIPGTYSGLSGVVIRNGSNVDVTSFYGVSFSGSYVVTKAAQTAVSVTSPAAGTYGNAFTATGSGGSGSGSLVWSLGTGSTASAAAINPSSGAITSTGAGTVVIKAMRAGDTNYLPSAWSADFTVTLAPRPLTVTLTGSKFYDGTTTASGASAAISSGSLAAGDALGNSFANTSSANTGTYSGLNTAAVTNSSAPTTRTSSYVITYAGVFTIAAAPQTITFGALPGKTYGDAPFGLTATASSGLPVSFSVSSGPASISGTTVTITGAGAVTIVASQSGNSNYQAAPGVSQSFTVAQAAQTVTLSPISQTILQTQSVSFTAAGGQNGYVWGGTSGASGSGASKVVSFPTAGTFTVTVQSPNAGNYLASSLVTATVTVNAAFTLTLTAEPGGNVSGAGLYQAGSVVNIAATTNPGRVFAGWYGPNAGSLADPYANTGTVVVSADLSLSARFLDYTVAPTVGTVNFGDASIPTGAGAKQALRDAIMGNSGNSSIELRSMTVVSGGTDFSVTGALGQIAAGGNVTNTVTFNPKGATLGPRTGRMVVATTDYAMPLFAYDLTANATSGALPPTLTLSVTSLALIFPNDNLLLNVRAEANTGNVAHYDWRVVTPSGPTGWTRASGPLALLVGNHAFSPTAIGAYVLEVIASHEAGLTSTGSLAFTVTQGMVTRVLNARSEPSPALQLWFTPSINRSQAIDVMKAR